MKQWDEIHSINEVFLVLIIGIWGHNCGVEPRFSEFLAISEWFLLKLLCFYDIRGGLNYHLVLELVDFIGI